MVECLLHQVACALDTAACLVEQAAACCWCRNHELSPIGSSMEAIAGALVPTLLAQLLAVLSCSVSASLRVTAQNGSRCLYEQFLFPQC
jgi:hypothetical protein